MKYDITNLLPLLYVKKPYNNLLGTDIVRTFAERKNMEARTLHNDKARFETRLSSNQKAIFERAANLGGYRSLSDFVVSTVQEKARKIIREHETILASQKDSEFFFEAILNAEKPNNKLVKASQRYQELLAK